ncbi:MAG: hypothetical protein LC674_05725, partial [Actinobacteria bacterium]|nr:hypothetical protein [Actinomycetota bacterium]
MIPQRFTGRKDAAESEERPLRLEVMNGGTGEEHSDTGQEPTIEVAQDGIAFESFRIGDAENRRQDGDEKRQGAE